MARTTYLQIELRGLREAQDWSVAQLRRLRGDNSPALKKIATDFYRMEREWFDSQGGGRWRPLSRRYAAYKAKFFPGKKILRRSDRLYREVTGKTKHFKVKKNALDILILGVPYWIAHETGTHKLPQREVIAPWIAQRIDSWHNTVTQSLIVNIRSGRR